MVATTDQKARLLDLTTGVLELVRDGKRDADEVCDVLQVIKEHRDFASILRRNQQVLVPEFKIWKTIKLGLRKSPDEYREALANRRDAIDGRVDKMLIEVLVSEKDREVDLVLVTGRKLGLTRNEYYEDICECALRLGLQKCPAEVALALREQYRNQPSGQRIMIGMEPITDVGGGRDVFVLGHDDYKLLVSHQSVDPGRVFNPNRLLVFVLPRK